MSSHVLPNIHGRIATTGDPAQLGPVFVSLWALVHMPAVSTPGTHHNPRCGDSRIANRIHWSNEFPLILGTTHISDSHLEDHGSQLGDTLS
jgi:hypothetical protein